MAATRTPPGRRHDRVIGQGTRPIAARPSPIVAELKPPREPRRSRRAIRRRPLSTGPSPLGHGWPTLVFVLLLLAPIVAVVANQQGWLPVNEELEEQMATNARAKLARKEIKAQTALERKAASDARAAIERGRAFLSKGDNIAAINEFDEAMRLDPKLVTAYFYRAAAQARNGHCREAIDDFTYFLGHGGGRNGWILATRGNCYLELGDEDRALEDFTLGMHVEPKHAALYAGRGAVYFRQLRFADAIQDIDKSLSLDRNQTDVLPILSMARLVLGQPEDAAKAAKDYLGRWGWNGDDSMLAAVLVYAAYIQSGDEAGARRILVRAAAFRAKPFQLLRTVECLLGERQECDFLEKSGNNEDRVMFHAAMGLSHLKPASTGDPSMPGLDPAERQLAKAHFERAADHGSRLSANGRMSKPVRALYDLARGMQRRLGDQES